MGAMTDPKPVGSDPPGAPVPKRGRQPQFYPALERVKERVLQGDGPDDWWQIAKYDNPQGAANAKRRIDRGMVKVPDGRWEFEARTLEAWDDEINATVVVGSHIVARYIDATRGRGNATRGKAGD